MLRREFGGQEIGRPLILLIGVPGGSFGEPIEPAADREPADDRAEMAAALGQVAFFRSNIRMETNRREIHVVSRAACIDPNGHQSVAD